ncbi:hypothetical protein jhhlp_002940 [Lomentospora prolificans]|uniref:2-dehydropantoate 2-reductase n=1 Tax=Lomentospora prolificans TaxID=41688 RepID=A0A2N3NFG0_9PEZI|nr:hypothetical protein jhhlp_002940 [Lomentospora prolificans]
MNQFSRDVSTGTANGYDRIHILGVGNLGKLVAYHLVKQDPQTRVTLLFHRQSLVTEWDAAGRKIECVTDGQAHSASGIDAEVVSSAESRPIKNLIVACKTFMTTTALSQVKNRLDGESTLLFIQNGMGTTEEVTSKLFPEAESRPSYWAGISIAGVYNTKPFSVVHAGKGPLILGPVPNDSQDIPSQRTGNVSPNPKANYMIEKLVGAINLQATVTSAAELRKAQLQKLTANAIINPLTAIFDCKNGELLDNGAKQALIEVLVSEMGPVIRALLPPVETQPDANLADFSDEKLLAYVHMVIDKTGKNTSSMLQDVKARRPTEIDYINGFIAARGEAFGLACPKHASLVTMVKEARVIGDGDIQGSILAKP